MKAIVLTAPGGPDHLTEQDIPKPVPDDGEVLVRVKAISINPVDIKARQGKAVYTRIKDETPVILGWDISGIVTESSSGLFQEGEEVFGMVNFPGHGKAYAELVKAQATHLTLKPAGISHAEAAAATLAALTAWQAMVINAQVQAGDKVLVHAASGGVGHFAVQIAKHLGAYVIGTSSGANRDFVLSLGADEHFDYQSGAFESAFNGLDFVFDTVGGDTSKRSLAVLREAGSLMSILGPLDEAGKKEAAEKKINASAMLVQSSGEHMREIANLLEQGIIKAHVSRQFNFSEIAMAHEQIETGRTIGKIIVKGA